MTPETFALALLITFLAVTIIDWLFAPAQRVMVVAIVLVLSLLWVYGAPIIIARRG